MLIIKLVFECFDRHPTNFVETHSVDVHLELRTYPLLQDASIHTELFIERFHGCHGHLFRYLYRRLLVGLLNGPMLPILIGYQQPIRKQMWKLLVFICRLPLFPFFFFLLLFFIIVLELALIFITDSIDFIEFLALLGVFPCLKQLLVLVDNIVILDVKRV